MQGLAGINIELTSRCNKACFCCGRRKLERDFPELVDWGDMPLEMAERIAHQIPKGVFVQLHNSGEPLLYPHFEEAVKLFKGHYVGLNTNGKLLMEQREAINQLSSITISMIPDDPEGDMQLQTICEFLSTKPKCLVVLRLLGEDAENEQRAQDIKDEYGVIICHRILHAPEGSHNYEKPVTIPETGICAEVLHKLCVDRFGDVFCCVRFDPHKKNLLGNVNNQMLESIWNSPTRKEWIKHHIEGERSKVPLCGTCHFWGIPRG